MGPPRETPKLFLQPGLASPLGVAVAAADQETIAMVAEAVRGRRLRLAYQPVVLSRDPGRVAYWEGMIRVEAPNGRIIPASDFIDAVEGSELGREIDCSALDQSLATLSRHPDLRISVNMSARSIGYARWMAILKRHLDKTPTLGERLILEMTEDSVLLVPELVLNFMDEISRKGVAFALDKFGAGFSAIRYFKDFQFDVLKIAPEFVRNVHRDPDNQTVIRALTAVGKTFEMLIVAEGVERPEEAAFLLDQGIDCQQGFLYAAPTVRPPWSKGDGVRVG